MLITLRIIMLWLEQSSVVHGHLQNCFEGCALSLLVSLRKQTNNILINKNPPLVLLVQQFRKKSPETTLTSLRIVPDPRELSETEPSIRSKHRLVGGHHPQHIYSRGLAGLALVADDALNP